MALALAAFQSGKSPGDAVATLKTALAASPKNKTILLALASYLHLDHQDSDAATVDTQVLALVSTPGDLNDASYTLAETGSDLPLAEQKARQALSLIDSQTVKADIGSANEQSFQQAYLLVAAWDTLGYILAKENKFEQARDYLEAAWQNLPSSVIALHYGSVLEKLGQKPEALRIYQLSTTSKHVPPSETAHQQRLRSSILRLKKAGVPSSVGDPTIDLQNARTFHLRLKSPCKAFRSATFRLQLQAGGIHSILLVTGDASLAPTENAIRHLALPHLVPTHSRAYLLRDAIVTCSQGSATCDMVLMPLGNITAEQAGRS